MVASLHLNVAIPIAQNAHEETMMESAAHAFFQDAEEVEDMPVDTPETEEAG
jgi:hypothetical protein